MNTQEKEIYGASRARPPGLLALVGGTALFGAALAAGCKKSPASPASAMSLLPKDTSLVVSVNVERLRSAKAWDVVTKQYLDGMHQRPVLDRFVKECKVNPFEDVASVLFAIDQKNPEGSATALVTAKNLDEKTLTQCLTKLSGDTFATETYGDHTLYEQPGTVLAFLDGKTLVVAGSKERAEHVLDLKDGKGDGLAANAELAPYVKRAPDDQAIWMAGTPPGAALQSILPGNGGSGLLNMIKGSYGSIDFAQGLAARFQTVCATSADAKKLADTLNALMDQARPFLDQIGASALAKGFKVSVNGDTAEIAVAVSEDDLQKAIQVLGPTTDRSTRPATVE